jgi:O-methyltransferase domain
MKRSWVPPAWLAKPGIRVRNALGRMHAKAVPPPLLVIERMNGLVESKTLSLVADLGIADRLAGGPRAAVHLAADAGVDPDALDRALSFLVSRGFFARTRDGRYENNATSSVLRSDHPESMREWARFFASDWHWAMWNHARHSIATGRSAAHEAFGTEFWDYLTRVNPAAGETFNGALAGTSAVAGPILARGYDFGRVTKLCDVGGGTGGMLAEILAVHPALRAALFDLPEVAERGRDRLRERGLLDRCEIVGGSFFETVPAGCDAYMMQSIIHDWDDDSCVTILTNIRRAMAPGARVLVIENVLSPEPSPADQFARSFDLVMLITSGLGRERTRAQFDGLFARAGFRIARDITLPSQFHVLELRATA